MVKLGKYFLLLTNALFFGISILSGSRGGDCWNSSLVVSDVPKPDCCWFLGQSLTAKGIMVIIIKRVVQVVWRQFWIQEVPRLDIETTKHLSLLWGSSITILVCHWKDRGRSSLMTAFLSSIPVIYLLLCFHIFQSFLVLNQDTWLLLLFKGVVNGIHLFHA